VTTLPVARGRRGLLATLGVGASLAVGACAPCGGPSAVARAVAGGASPSATAGAGPRAMSLGATRIAAGQVIPPDAAHGLLQRPQPVLLFFMATGCASCVADASAITSALSGTPPVVVLAVDLVGTDSPTDLSQFLEGAGLRRFPFVWTVDRGGQLAQRYGIQALGEVVGVAGGRVLFHDAPGVAPEQLRRQLRGLSST
jgi:hypothetical protein